MEQQPLFTATDQRFTLIATKCLVCRRRLRDAESVNCGIGPDCRDHIGYTQQMTPAVRTKANIILVEMACAPCPDVILRGTQELQLLGLGDLAKRIATHWASVKITKLGPFYEVRFPFRHDAVRGISRIRGRKYNDHKYWTVPLNQRVALWRWAQQFYSKSLAISDNGPFIIN